VISLILFAVILVRFRSISHNNEIAGFRGKIDDIGAFDNHFVNALYLCGVKCIIRKAGKVFLKDSSAVWAKEERVKPRRNIPTNNKNSVIFFLILPPVQCLIAF